LRARIINYKAEYLKATYLLHMIHRTD